MRKTQAIKTIFASMLSMLALNFASVVISDGAYAQNPAPHSKSSGAIGAASWANLSQRDRRIARENYLSSLKFPAEKKSEAWQAYQQLTDEQKQKLAAAENSKKKPTAANAPTLQQHPVSKQPTTGL